jgi:hypothetical protein
MLETTLSRWDRDTHRPGEPPRPFLLISQVRWVCLDSSAR